MKNEIMRFVNEKFGEIQILQINGKFEFGATEIAKILGYNNPRDAIKRHCKKDGVVKHDIIDKLGRNQEKNFISEGNLYRLITHSKLPNAENFEKWVFDEVLPSIRKNGGYLLGQESMSEEEIMARAILYANSKIKELEQENVVKENLIKEYEPKVTYLDQILASKDLINITVIAKDYGMSAKAFNQLLADNKIQYKVGKQWFLYSEYQDKGYTSSYTQNIEINGETKVVVAMKWTQQGRLFLYNFLKEQDVVPLIERNLAVQLSLV